MRGHANVTTKAILFYASFALAMSANAGHASDKTDESENDDPLQIVVSLNEQSLRVYRGAEIVATSRVSSGKPGHSTPTGIFSILHKKKFHRSNIYSNAPMPWMQRLTWTGIALHESNHVPDYPASHGCVRLPREFARELYKQTAVGQHVVITGEPAAPRSVAHEALPQPSGPAAYDPLKDHWRIRFEAAGKLRDNPAPSVSTAALLKPVRDKIGFARQVDGPPLRILITRRSRQQITADIQTLLNELGYEAGPIDGIVGPATWGAVKRFQADHDMPENGAITPQFSAALYAAVGIDQPENGRVFVRSDFEPVFDAPISIDRPDQPLGTHLITATAFDAKARKTGWMALTLENQLPEFTRAYFNIAEDASHDVAAIEVLDRITIPDHVRRRIAGMLTPGSSIAISDTGLGPHTGWKTDFVVVTRTGRRA